MEPNMAGNAGDTAAREIISRRVVNAPQAKVFRAFTDPEILAEWWGPDGFTNTFHEFDLRPGGKWRFVMHGPDGTDYKNESIFVDITTPERIVFNHVSGHFFEMTLTFEPEGEQTRFGFRMLFKTPEERDRVAAFAVDKNEENFDRLELALERMA